MDWNFLIRNKSQITVSTDTRTLSEGCVFVALKGERFNGNLFALQALEMGAEYVIVDEDIPQTCSMQRSYEGRIIRVENSLLALQDLARAWRQQWAKTVIGITGTNGKTTTKELTAAVLSTKYNVLYTEGNLNNQIGVPLTLLRLRDEHDIAIIEMGASHPGDIKELVEIAEPDCGLITNVGRAHLQGFGSFEGVMQTKAELYDYLRGGEKFCFRNLDNPYLAEMAGGLKTVSYQTGIMLTGTHLVGDYNSENIQAAICVGKYFGVSEEDAIAAIRAYVPSNNRSQIVETKQNTLLVDAYNANPTSMQAAIQSFLKTYSKTHIMSTTPAPLLSKEGKKETHLHASLHNAAFILGDMLELGEDSRTEHQNIVNMLAEQKAENVWLVGNEFAKTNPPYPVFQSTEEIADYLKEHHIEGKTILIKGSHGMHLERLIPLL